MEIKMRRRDNYNSLTLAFQCTRRTDIDTGQGRCRVLDGWVENHWPNVPGETLSPPLTPPLLADVASYIIHVLAYFQNLAPSERQGLEQTINNIIALLQQKDGQRCRWTCVNLTDLMNLRPTVVVPAAPLLPEMQALQAEIGMPAGGIHCHSYKPHTKYLRMGASDKAANHPEHPMYFGVECEIDSPDDNRTRNREGIPPMVNPLFYCKEDGSLRRGVELVSYPASEMWWRDKAPTVTKLLLQVRGLGWRGLKETCGMHVHLSKSGFFGRMHMYRFLHLVYREPRLTLEISQRAEGQLNQWANLKLNERKKLKGKVGLSYVDAYRYEAVNITRNTAEVRIFRGTLQPDVFYKNMEYLWALLAFTKATTNLRQCSALNFTAWTFKREKMYPHLVAFMAQDTEVGRTYTLTGK